ncbi:MULTISPECIES: hypothetical protein [unclassified Pseudofrankia]|uniref:hypothetical protein n=1 Tax=unclassified Pseudofrankia TaxID=2994372 RepID=UPI0008D8EEDF|nr:MULTISPECIES: hypothetical protein [unclassified Pseudofrankia]MDT3444618.1 hypothetical protein [Pseudofrankia sp. BMG5.37]OHV47432.1 hypothetical protein BCD48_18945 [Pseudofrankia sp. BMG5.36]
MALAHPRRARIAACVATAALAVTACSSSGSTPTAAPSPGGSVTPATVAPASSTPGGGSGSSIPAAPETESNPAGDIPDSQAFVTYAPAGAPYSVEVPEGWARTTATGGATFTDKYNMITITVAKAAPSDPVAYAKATELPAVQAASQGFADGKVVGTVRRKAGPAVLMTYRAYSPPNPVTGKVAVEDVERYEFFQAGTEVALTLAGPVGSDNVDPWRQVTDSFRWR